MNFFRRLRGSREARIAERMTDDMPRPKISAKLSSPSTTAESSPSPTSSSELRRQNSQSSETSDTTTSLVMPSARPPKRHSRNPTETRLTLAAKMTKRVNLLEAIDMSNFSPAYVEKSEASIAIIDEALQLMPVGQLAASSLQRASMWFPAYESHEAGHDGIVCATGELHLHQPA
eukprot:scaffold396_cov252-Pinguiococcus_pyrenoidosus.AAC.4